MPEGSELRKLGSSPSLEEVRAVLEVLGLQFVPVRDLLHMVAEKRRCDILLSTMQVFMEEPMRLDPRDFTVALSLCSKLKVWQDACLILQAMPKAGVQANIYCFNATISAFGKGGQWQRALALFQDMLKAEVQADDISFNASISAFEKGGQWQRALALFQDMLKAEVQADDISFSATISACEKGGQWQQALALFQAMPQALVQADVCSFNAAISACEKGGQWQRALSLFQVMPKSKVQANLVSFSATISSCEKGGQWQQALALFQHMTKAEVQADYICFSASISACEKGGQWQQALALFHDMTKAEVQADDISFNASISACEKGGQWQQALALFHDMTKAEVQADDISFNASISACEKGGQWQQALSLFLEMQQAELKPGEVSYNCLLDAVQGKPLAIDLFQKALQDRIYQKLAAARWNLIDLHDLSEAAAQLAVWWWLHAFVLPELSNRLRSGAPCRCEVVTGYGKSRKDWGTSDIRAAVMSLLQHLNIPFQLCPRNPGLLELSFSQRDLPLLQQCLQKQFCIFILPVQNACHGADEGLVYSQMLLNVPSADLGFFSLDVGHVAVGCLLRLPWFPLEVGVIHVALYRFVHSPSVGEPRTHMETETIEAPGTDGLGVISGLGSFGECKQVGASRFRASVENDGIGLGWP